MGGDLANAEGTRVGCEGIEVKGNIQDSLNVDPLRTCGSKSAGNPRSLSGSGTKCLFGSTSHCRANENQFGNLPIMKGERGTRKGKARAKGERRD